MGYFCPQGLLGARGELGLDEKSEPQERRMGRLGIHDSEHTPDLVSVIQLRHSQACIQIPPPACF